MNRFHKTWIAFAVILALGCPVWAGVDTGNVDVEIHSSSWFRYEANSNTRDFNEDFGDDAEWTQYRIRLSVEANYENIRTYFEGQAFDFFGNNTSQFYSGDGDTLNIYQAFFEVTDLWNEQFSFKIGRQELVFGDEFILGDLDFYQGQAFDAIRFDWHNDRGRVTVFDAKLVEVPGNSNADDINLYGIYSSWSAFENHTFDAYGMYYSNRMNPDMDGDGIADYKSAYAMPTIGFRMDFDSGEAGWDYKAEAAWQGGEINDDIDHNGFAGEGSVSYTFDNDHLFWIGIKTAYYSGDDKGADDDADFFLPFGQDYAGRYGRYDYLSGAYFPDLYTALGTGSMGVPFWASPVIINNMPTTAFPGAIIANANFGFHFADTWTVGLDVTHMESAIDKIKDYDIEYETDWGWGADIHIANQYNEHLDWLVSLSAWEPGDALKMMEDQSPDTAWRGYIQGRVNW